MERFLVFLGLANACPVKGSMTDWRAWWMCCSVNMTYGIRDKDPTV
jgi:hypothetical protein